MQKDIALRGLTTTPSSHESPDGDIAAMLNLVNEDGALKPIANPYKIGSIEDGAMLWVHETPDYLHYIKRLKDGTWWWTQNINANSYDKEARAQVYVIDYTGSVSSALDTTEIENTMSTTTPSDITTDLPARQGLTGIDLRGNKLVILGELVQNITIQLTKSTAEDTSAFTSAFATLLISNNLTDKTYISNRGSIVVDGTKYNVYQIHDLPTSAEEYDIIAGKSPTGITSTDKSTYAWIRIESDLDNTEEVTDLAYDGNVLVVSSTDQPLQYVIWRMDDSCYQYLGQVPKIELDFGLSGEVKYENYGNILNIVSDNAVQPTQYSEIQTYTEALYDLTYTHNQIAESQALALGMVKGNKYYFLCKGDSCYLHINGDKNKAYSEKGYVYTYNGGEIKITEASSDDGLLRTSVVIYDKDDDSKYDPNDTEYSIEDSADNHTAMLGAVSKYLYEYCEQKNKYVLPFFVRFGIKMYDDTIVYASAPQLMIPNWGATPMMLVNYEGSKEDGLNGNVTMAAYVCDMYYKIKSIGNISAWEDVITDVIISVSQPVGKENLGDEYSKDLPSWRTYKVASSHMTDCISVQKDGTLSLYDKASLQDADFLALLPTYTDAEYKKNLQNASNFYEVGKIEFDDIKVGTWTKIDEEEYNLLYPETGKKLSFDNLYSRNIYAKKLKEYNGRLHLVQVEQGLPTDESAVSPIKYDDSNIEYRLNIKSKVDGKENDYWSDIITGDPRDARYFSSIDDGVYKVIIYCHVTTTTASSRKVETYIKTSVDVEKADVSTGSYAFNTDGFTWQASSKSDFETESTNTTSISHHNEIYVSEVDNPFVFPSANAVQCGRGTITGVAVNTETISEGQFGDSPLYAFTTEETWVLSLADTGVYQTKQVLANSICINDGSITGLTNGVVYTTVNGIMYAQGKQVTCISDSLRDAVSKYTLPHLGDIMTAKGLEDRGNYVPDYTYEKDWLEFLRTCGIAHDKVNDRIIVYPKNSDLAFVYSLRSNLWGMMGESITGKVDKAGAQWVIIPGTDDDGNDIQIIADLADNKYATDKTTTYDNQYVISRPLGLDIPNIHKRITSMIMRGYFRKGSVACAVYGGRNLFDWHLIWTSKDQYLRCQSGTPYKYFIVVAVCNLASDERLQGMSFDFEPHDTDQQR